MPNIKVLGVHSTHMPDADHMSVDVGATFPQIDGWKIQVNDFMPPKHIMVSRDVYEHFLAFEQEKMKRFREETERQDLKVVIE